MNQVTSDRVRRRVHIGVIVGAMVATVALQALFWSWYIEDAAISFAYARHLAEGEGLVTYPGGERVEGYSNPLWTFLMAALQLVGVDGFWSSKLLAMALGAAAVPLVWALARETREEPDEVPLVAALVLGTGAQFVIWNASGLENALFSFLLALAMWLGVREARTGAWPWSALAYFGLAITRPEAILYCAFAGFWAMVVAFREGRGPAATAKWLLTFFAPFGLYHAARYAYFAWEFPNTFYSKLGRRTWAPYSWGGGGWKYLRGWAAEVGHGWLVPVYVVAMTGLRRWRALGALLALAVLGTFLLLPGPDALAKLPFWPSVVLPGWWVQARVWVLLAATLLLPLGTLRRKGGDVIALCWGMTALGVFFTLYSSGDWMRGYRWLSLISVPSAVVFAVGAGEIAGAISRLAGRLHDRLPTPARLVPLLALAAAAVAPSAVYLEWYTGKTETSPYSVRKRVNYNRWIANRVHLLDRPVVLDVDMGANMWWGGFEIVDIAGLVDVPMGHHKFQNEFVDEYVLTERRPHLAHAHGSWERTMKLSQQPKWREGWIEIPGYPSGKKSLHVGNHVRRDLIFDERWTGAPGRRVELADGVALEGVDFPAAGGEVGRPLYFEIGFSSRARSDAEAFRPVVFLSSADGVVASYAIPPAYDWIEPSRWKDGETFHGRFSMPVPETLPSGAPLPPGDYDLGVVVFGPDGAPLAPITVPGNATTDAPRFAQGEVRFPGAVRLMAPTEFLGLLARVRSEVDAEAEAGACERAESAWVLTQRTATKRAGWLDDQRPAAEATLAACWIARAATLEADEDKARALDAAHDWDHWAPGLDAAVQPVADRLAEQGWRARTAGDWETAYRAWTLALAIDPTRSALRRAAEEARDQRLGIDPDSAVRKERERLKRLEDAKRERPAKARPPKPTEAKP